MSCSRSCVLLAVCALLVPSTSAADLTPIKSFFRSHCIDCHDGDSAEAGLDLAGLQTELSADNFEQWVRIHDRVTAGEMPPTDWDQPAERDVAKFGTTVRHWLTDHERQLHEKEGRVQARRLTNLQLERTLQDLLGVDIPLASRMPDEPRHGEFVTVASEQSISHYQLQTHLAVVDVALDEAFRRATTMPDEWSESLSARDIARRNPKRRCREPEMLNDRAVVWASKLIFYGRLPATTASEDGWYRLKVRASGLNVPEKHGVWCTVRTGRCVSGAPLMAWAGAFEVGEEQQEWTFEAWLPKGHMFEVRPGDDTLRMARFGGGQVGAGEGEPQNVAGVAIESVELQRIHRGPDDDSIRNLLFDGLKIVPAKRRKDDVRVDSATPEADARRLVQSFARRAFRRSVADADLEPYVQIAIQAIQDNQPLLTALRDSYRAILCSPRFLYFHEQPGELDDFAIANRLSYLLWNSMPDEDLMRLAAQNQLREKEVLRKQVHRMLEAPRGQDFVKNFADEWLDLRDIDFTEPDRRLYPGFDVIVQNTMLAETQTFLRNMLDHDLSVGLLIDSDFTFLNSRLARYYGIDRVAGDAVREVALRPEDHRGGLLTHGSVLKVTANGTTTSPVLRGIWVSERLLGVDIPPPPSSVPAIEPDIRGASTIREMLEKHKSDTNCASCHVKIDPPGFAMENFDPSGRWRDHYAILSRRKRNKGPKIDPGFQLPDGRDFSSFEEFQELILQNKPAIAANVVRKLMAYGTGAACSFSDREAVHDIVHQSADADYGFRTLLTHVVTSDTFLTK